MNKNTKVIIEFNETCESVRSFKNQKLTTSLLNKIKKFDSEYELKDIGYLKFYFEIYEDDKMIDQVRLDVGDGVKLNDDIYNYLEKYI